MTGATVGDVVVPKPNPDCETTHEENKARREELDKFEPTKRCENPEARKIQVAGQTIDGIDGCGVTISNARFTSASGGSSIPVSAQSNYTCLTAELKKGVVEGNPAIDRANGSLLDCDGNGRHPYKGPPEPSQAGGHCETRTLDELVKNGQTLSGGTLSINIDWRQDGKKLKHPCEGCHDMLCYAVKECELNVELCTNREDEDPPESVNMANFCPYDYDNRKSLSGRKKRNALLEALGGFGG
ncbi:MAG: hypothetical protein FWG14_07285 [Peptococcaceae bacterium]|nr:hypothetical protein [Peptococcaceae bacterium]